VSNDNEIISEVVICPSCGSLIASQKCYGTVYFEAETIYDDIVRVNYRPVDYDTDECEDEYECAECNSNAYVIRVPLWLARQIIDASKEQRLELLRRYIKLVEVVEGGTQEMFVEDLFEQKYDGDSSRNPYAMQ